MMGNLTRSSIKNKIFEITKEFKEFRFQQNLPVELAKNDEVFKSKIFTDPWFDLEEIEFSYINIDELIDIQNNQLSSRVERWIHEGSDWTVNSILKQRVISEITPCEESSCFPLHKELRNPMKGLINIQDEDNECFR